MPSDSYHGSDGRALGRRVRDLLETEAMQVSCRRCSRTMVYRLDTFRNFRSDCPLIWLEADLAPRCWTISESRPDGCQREVVWLDASDEDGCVSDEG